ncbi:hypothetical protein RRF57_009557 [Xylaria bambusicola]|uniref:Uncharacterized protein n=1 Tax=Xylaria bambusicola TaxID=326684 RepID=A0AAN7UV62_9PEZI
MLRIQNPLAYQCRLGSREGSLLFYIIAIEWDDAQNAAHGRIFVVQTLENLVCVHEQRDMGLERTILRERMLLGELNPRSIKRTMPFWPCGVAVALH